MKKIAIFASGSGSNAENIIQYFKDQHDVSIELILTNNSNAYVLERAKKFNVPSFVFNRNDFYKSQKVEDILVSQDIDLVVLAGFMWLVPDYLVQAFPNKIINIHPALLPKYGGKGMYGDFVHQAVSKAGENNTGITIHYVNDKYDDGNIIFQKSIAIIPGENPDLIAEQIHALEYEYFPKVIEEVLLAI